MPSPTAPDCCETNRASTFPARVTVHFNAVCERFSPYDTTFDIADAKDLKDTKLSAACSLHAASGSNSSATSSIRRRRLVEIAEEEEEEQQQRASKRQSLGNEAVENDRPQTPKSDNDVTSDAGPVTLNSDLASSPKERKFSASSTSDVPQFVGADETPASPDAGDAAGRLSSQSGRPDYLNYPYSYGKPKVKLGPRPSLDVNGRPRTAGSFRPVSQIPAGMKMFGKNSKKGKKDDEDESTEGLENTNTAPIPEEDDLAPTEMARPTTSSGVSTAATIIPAPPPSKPVISPEKARLMKAMKLREKKKKKNMTVDPSGTVSPDILSPTPSMLEAISDENAEDKAEELDDQPFMSNADSAIGLDASSSMTTDQGSDLTQSDSHPASPVILSSEPDHSTKASSLSGSTDETVHAKSDDAHDESKDPEDDAQNLADPALESENQGIETTASEVPAAAPALEKASEGSVPTETLEAHATADGVAVPDTDSHSVETKSESKTQEEGAAPIIEPESIPAPKTFPTEALASGDRSKPGSIPVVEEIKEVKGEVPVVKNEEDSISPIATPTLTVSEPKFPDQAVPLTRSYTTPPTDDKPDDDGEATAEAKTKRRVFVEPIRTDLVRPESHADNLSDDDDLMEELQSATVQEAKSMLVSKSPVTPVFPSPTKSERSLHFVRTVSNPVRGTFLVPGDVSQSSARSVSSGAAYLHKVAQQPTGPNLAKKSNMGSSISQRIKALEKLSASTGEAPAIPRLPSRERPSSTFFSVRKGREPSRSPSVADRANSFTRPSVRTPPSTSGSRDESPDTTRRPPRDRSLSVASRLSMFEPPTSDGQSVASVTAPRGRPEAISVTAKIVRDAAQPAVKTLEPPKDPAEFAHLELKQSPLVVDHQKPVWTPVALEHKEKEKDNDPQHERRVSKDSNMDNKSRRSSLSVVKDFIKERRRSVTSITSEVFSPGSHSGSRSPTRPPSINQNTSFTQRLSISSRRSSFNKDRESILSPTGTEGSASGDDKSTSDKKKSRTGRFMRRLSGFGSRGKISAPTGISPTVTEEDLSEPVRPATTAGNASIVANMGDVNVQFPDNLLWKRRNMCMDAQGFLILSAIPGQSGRAAQGTKRYHMGDFRQPYPPDVEVQELPNSVVLDFMEGSGIQVACEDRAGQLKVLKSKHMSMPLS